MGDNKLASDLIRIGREIEKGKKEEQQARGQLKSIDAELEEEFNAIDIPSAKTVLSCLKDKKEEWEEKLEELVDGIKTIMQPN